MAFCLTPRNHYLNQWWLLMSEVLWHSSESNFTASTQGTILYNEFKNFTFKIPATSPRGQWVNSQKPPHICHDIMSLYSTGYYWQCCGSFLHGLSWTSSGIISGRLGDKSYQRHSVHSIFVRNWSNLELMGKLCIICYKHMDKKDHVITKYYCSIYY